MQQDLAEVLPALLDLWFWETPGWTISSEDGLLVVCDGSGEVVADARLDRPDAVRRLTALASTVNLINNNLESFRDPYRSDAVFSALMSRVREAEDEAAELRAENASLIRRLHYLDPDSEF